MDTEQRENLDEEVVTPATEVEQQVPVEMTPEDAEAEEEFTLKEEEWRKDLEHEIETWKKTASTIAGQTEDSETAKRDISHIRESGHSREDVQLFHAYEQLKKSNSLFYKKKFEDIADERLQRLEGKYEDPEFCLARLLKSLRKKSVTEMKDAA